MAKNGFIPLTNDGFISILFFLFHVYLFFKMNKGEEEIHPLVVIHNIINLTTKDVERYCLKYDKNVHCYRKKNRHNHQYIHAFFSSIITANHFLNDRPHFIQNYRIKYEYFFPLRSKLFRLLIIF